MLTMLKRLHKDKRGITGLETGIILVAFVVVASVFAYTVISAGMFSSQKGQEASTRAWRRPGAPSRSKEPLSPTGARWIPTPITSVTPMPW